jgi:hypothetical protein
MHLNVVCSLSHCPLPVLGVIVLVVFISCGKVITHNWTVSPKSLAGLSSHLLNAASVSSMYPLLSAFPRHDISR